MVPEGASIFVVSGSSVNERHGSNALVFRRAALCLCVCVYRLASRRLAVQSNGCSYTGCC